MTSGIGGPGGPSGPRGPGRPDGPDGPGGVDGPGQPLSIQTPAGAAGTGAIDRLAADLEAGRISPEEALTELMAEAIPEDMTGVERADLEALLGDLLASDPYLAGLAAQLGVKPSAE